MATFGYCFIDTSVSNTSISRYQTITSFKKTNKTLTVIYSESVLLYWCLIAIFTAVIVSESLLSNKRNRKQKILLLQRRVAFGERGSFFCWLEY